MDSSVMPRCTVPSMMSLGERPSRASRGAFRRIAGNARLVKGRLGGFHFRLGAAQVQFADEALFITAV